MYKRVLIVMAVTLLVALYFNLHIKAPSARDPWRGVDINGKITPSQQSWLREKEVLLLGISDELLPHIREEEGIGEGLLADYMDVLMEPLKAKVRYRAVSKEELPKLLLSSQIDGALMISTSNLPPELSYSSPLIPAKGSLFLKSMYKGMEKEGLRGKKIISTDKQALYLQGFDFNEYNHITEAASLQEGIEYLQKGDYDGIVGSETALFYLLKEKGLRDQYLKYPGYVYEKNIVLVTADGGEACGIMNTAAYYIDREVVLPELQLKWYGVSYELHEETSFGNIAILLFIMVAGIIFVFYLFYYSNKSLYDELSQRMEMLRLSRNELQATFDGVDYLMAEVGIHNEVVNINRAFGEYLKIHRRDAIAQQLSGLLNLHGETESKVHQAIQEAFRNEKTQQLEISVGRSILEFRFFPIKDSRERVMKLLLMIVDVTAQRSAERQMIQDNKMIAIGQLAAGVAHELRNPLGIIRNYCFLLRTQWRDNPAMGEKTTEVIEKSVERSSKIIENLLNFSRSGKNQAEEIDLKNEIDGIISFHGKSLQARNIQLTLCCPSGMLVRVFTESLEMVLMNLISNAADAIYNGGAIDIEAWEEGDQIIIEVRDSGSGISGDIKGEIFNPFFTTKEKHEGNGLGLYLVYNEVMKINGSIELETEIGKGTTFRISFPKTGGDIH